MTEEVWRPIPIEIVGAAGYYASNHGRLRLHDALIKPGKGSKGPKDGRYKMTRINGHTQYFHRLMYFAFHPKDINLGRVLMKDIIDPQIDSNSMFDLKLEDLLFQKNKTVDHGDEISDGLYIHPVYGPYKINGWFPVKCYVKDKLIAFDNYDLKLTTNPEYPCKIRSKYNNLILKYSYQTDAMMQLTEKGNTTKLLLTHIMLSTVFPDVVRNESVDHIDNNHKNNHITNLQWLSRSQNSTKNSENKRNIKRANKKIRMIIDDHVHEFDSVTEASVNIAQRSSGTLKTIQSKIYQALDKNRVAYGCTFRTVYLLEG